jgi:hypothetical protein
MKIILIFIFLILFTGTGHTGIIVVPKNNPVVEDKTLLKYENFTGGYPLEKFKERKRQNKHSTEKPRIFRNDVQPLDFPIYRQSQNSKFRIKFNIQF